MKSALSIGVQAALQRKVGLSIVWKIAILRIHHATVDELYRTLLQPFKKTEIRSPTSQTAVVRVSFSLQAGEIGVLIGTSVCGKTTLLRAVAGLERAQVGTITLDCQLASSTAAHVPAESRRIGMVFQDYALLPHLDVARNVGFGLMHPFAAQLRASRKC
jgi:ABC-type Fe3+/spermidine/putrescine transport system ATPase subunit